MKTLTEILNNIKYAEQAVYDRKRVIKFIRKYPELKQAYFHYKVTFPRLGKVDKSLRLIFNSYILNDPALEREYKQMV